MSGGSAERAGSTRRGYLVAAAIAGALLLAAVYAAFVREIPLTRHFEIKGIFQTSNNLRPGSDVRIGGVHVGDVERVTRGPGATAAVTMRFDRDHLPIRTDARLAIVPRLVVEGNDYVKVSLGTPGAPALTSGGVIPIAQTTVPVQLDQVVDVFTRPSRDSLVSTMKELRTGLGSGEAHTESVSGATALRAASRELNRALGSVTAVARAAQGTAPGDLSRSVRGSGDVAAQMVSDPVALAGIITHYNRTVGAFASRERSLAAILREADRLLRDAPAKLASIDGALPSLTRFATALRPSLRVAPTSLRKLTRAAVQLGLLVDDNELPRLLRSLRPVAANLAPLQRQLRVLFPLVTSAMSCVSKNVVPVLNKKISDGANTTGQPVWQEFLHMTANLAGTSQDFDGNGTTIRLGVTQQEQVLRYTLPQFGDVFATGDIQGVRPVWLGLGAVPPYRPDQRCSDQQLPDLNSRSGGRPAGIRSVRRPAETALDRLVAQFLAGSRRAAAKLVSRLPAAPARRRRAHSKRPAQNPVKAVTTPLSRPPAGATTPPAKPDVTEVLPKLIDGVLPSLGLGGTSSLLGRPLRDRNGA